jgi:adenine-specific DNA methylase
MKGDALSTIGAGEGADILYLDPPYGGTLSYEEEYRIIDEILGERHEPSAFSRRDGLDYFVSLLTQCEAYPLWVISYGNAVVDLQTVKAAIERFRPARAVEIAYSHMTAVATKEKREANREFIVLAWKPGSDPDREVEHGLGQMAVHHVAGTRVRAAGLV